MPTAALTCPGQELGKQLQVVREMRLGMLAEMTKLVVRAALVRADGLRL